MLYDLLFPLTAYHWLILGLVLLSMEALGAAGFLLGPAAAAFAVGVALLIVDFHWHWQVSAYAVLAIALSVMYWAKFRGFNKHREDHSSLNDRAAQLIGRRFQADRAVDGGAGKLRIGDTLWNVTSEDTIAESQTVEVVASKGMTLNVKRVA
jgi:membrane protein implicated in regulation of membrane protease activity